MIKFIIIDDEPYVTSLFSTILNWKSFDFELVGTFSSGNEAMLWLEQNECDVIFTDVCMPDMTGTEIAMHCYRNSPQVLIVFFSAHRNFDYALDAIKYNVFDYILKPLSQAALIDTVSRLKAKIAEIQHETVFSEVSSVVHDDTQSVIQLAMQYINEHYSEDISVADVAKHVLLSPGYFSNYFKQKTNEKFVDVLKRIRLEKAKQLLKDKNVKISHIPQQIGFKSYSYFTRVFQSSFGITPSDYRNNLSKQVTHNDKIKKHSE